jgi:uncharacterized protein (DUF433 family)
MDESNPYMTLDEHGVRRVAKTRISIDSVVLAFQQGDSAEEIQRNFPSLSLEQVYGTITYYLADQKEVETYLQQQRARWEQSRAKTDAKPSAALDRLRKLRATKSEQVG